MNFTISGRSTSPGGWMFGTAFGCGLSASKAMAVLKRASSGHGRKIMDHAEPEAPRRNREMNGNQGSVSASLQEVMRNFLAGADLF
jgi:hypothetical protein